MKTLLLTLLLISSSVVLAGDYIRPGSKGTTIGERVVDAEIMGSIGDHYLDGCDEIGFHLAAEKLAKDVYKFHTYCGPAPKGIDKYRITKDDGI